MEKWRVNLELDKLERVYYAGQTIAGLARVELDQPIHIVGRYAQEYMWYRTVLHVVDMYTTH